MSYRRQDGQEDVWHDVGGDGDGANDLQHEVAHLLGADAVLDMLEALVGAGR